MFGSVVLDVVIGLIFIFLLHSLLASILHEGFANLFSLRARMLRSGIIRMLQDDEAAQKKQPRFGACFFLHPAIKYLAQGSLYKTPSYLEADNFSRTVMAMLQGIHFQGTVPSMQEIRQSIAQKKFQDSEGAWHPIEKETALQLNSLFVESRADAQAFKTLLEKWFNDTMGRTIGWYKRQTQFILLGIGFFLAVLFNVDSLAIYRILSRDKTARDQLVQLAINQKDKYKSIVQQIKLNDSTKKLNVELADTALSQALGTIQSDAEKSQFILGLGRPWSDSCKICSTFLNSAEAKDKKNNKAQENAARCRLIQAAVKDRYFLYNPNQAGGVETFLGWLITALAISLGAPFWFDILNKVIQFRGGGVRPADSKSAGKAPKASSGSGTNPAANQKVG